MQLARLPEAIALVAGGLAAGTVIVSYVLAQTGGISSGDLFLPYSAAAILLAASLLTLRRPETRWMWGELAAAAVFYAAFAAGWLAPSPRVIELVMALAAAALLVCYGQSLRAQGEELPSLVIVAGLLEGSGLASILAALVPAIIRPGLPAGAVAMVLAMMFAYRWYEWLERLRASAATEPGLPLIETLTPWVLTIACALPFAIYGAVLFIGDRWAAAAAGGCAIVGSAVWKVALATRDASAAPAAARATE